MDIAFSFPMSQLYAWGGAALVALAVIAWGLRTLERFRGRRIEIFVEHQLAPRLLSGVDATLRRPLFWFALFGFIALGLALAQPHWGQSFDQITRRSHDIIVCLDVSESMLAENPLPTRLERAKQKIASVVDRDFGDRFGLVAFSGAAELMCPLTLDHGYYRTVLNAVDTDSISMEGTDLAAAIEVAVATFQDQDADGGERSAGSRAIMIISDGESVSGDALAAAEKAAPYARIFVMGVGDPRGTEVVYRNRFARSVQLEPEESTHMSKLDESTLARLAQIGEGGYIRTTAHDGDVEEMFGLIQQLFAQDMEGDIRQQLVNRFQWPLAFAVICFTAEGLWLVMLPWVRRWRERHDGVTTEEETSYA